jgi:hypothetical protein
MKTPAGLVCAIALVAYPIAASAQGAVVNLALNKPATQSSLSQWSTGPNDAQGAVDGRKDGRWGFHTDSQQNPWWQVDLLAPSSVSEIRVFNRLDVPERADNLQVMVSTTGADWRMVYANSARFGGSDGRPLVVRLNGQTARYVRLQLPANTYFHLDEVEIFGSPSAGQVSQVAAPISVATTLTGATNLALNKPATQSSLSSWSTGPNDAQGAVDGRKDGRWGFHTNAEPNPWWQVDLLAPSAISEIRLFNRMDIPERANNLQIMVSTTGSDWRTIYAHNGAPFGGADGRPLVARVDGTVARYVRLQVPSNTYFHLDEVEILGVAGAPFVPPTAPTVSTNFPPPPVAPTFPAAAGGNVALNKPAIQSSLSSWSTGSNDAQGAVNGVKDGKWGFHTNAEPNPWWQVDLLSPMTIGEIRLFNRLDIPERANNLQVMVSATGGDWQTVFVHSGAPFGGADGRPLVARFNPTVARYVRLQVPANTYFHLDEVEIYGPGGGGAAPVSGSIPPVAIPPAPVIAPTPVAANFSAMEFQVDRPGADYRSFDLPAPDPGLCQATCNGDGSCRAWTFVNPGYSGGSQARCWLKSAVPAPLDRTPCCVSGVKAGSAPVTPPPPAVVTLPPVSPPPPVRTTPPPASGSNPPNPADIGNLLTGLSAQDRQEMTTYVLTPATLQRIVDVNAQMFVMLANDAALRKRMKDHATGGKPADQSLDSAVNQFERHPEITGLIRRGGVSVREYIVSQLVIVMTMTPAENVKNGIERAPAGVLGQNVNFMNTNTAQLERWAKDMERMISLFP